MSRIGVAIISLSLVVILSVFFFFSPQIFGQTAAGNGEPLKELLIARFTTLGNSIAHSAFVEDAIIMKDEANLSEIIMRLRRDEPELGFINFTDNKNKIISSSDPNIVGEPYNPDLLEAGNSVVRENNGVYEGGFSIMVGTKRVGAFYFEAKPKVASIKISSSSSPVILVAGIVVGFILFVVTLSVSRSIETKLIEDINKRQESLFSAKVQSLRKDQSAAQERLSRLNSEIVQAQETLRKFTEEYVSKRKEVEDNPIVQSIEKLKESEAALLKRLEGLKEEESKLNTEISLLTQKREEVRSALEAEKKEESTLHEKLDLIKKKILHLETPGK
ncbi:MAG: hypothetical protein JSV97_01370 [candidate division WOR-3 bacterium]|nr:MAG: hypothetical protein JSV97_01370 [candidate division WOR-3 bacterium]